MKLLMVLIIALSPFAADAKKSKSSGSKTHVRAHTTKNGTHVRAHHRTKSDHTKSNNWSTKGNTNPETGNAGTKDR